MGNIKGQKIKFYSSKTASEALSMASTEPSSVFFTERGIVLDGKVYAEPNEEQTDYTVQVTKKDTANNGASTTYHISQPATSLNIDIDIPKDMVVSGGEVKEIGDNEVQGSDGSYLPAGAYLVLTLANATNDKVYINVASLYGMVWN